MFAVHGFGQSYFGQGFGGDVEAAAAATPHVFVLVGARVGVVIVPARVASVVVPPIVARATAPADVDVEVLVPAAIDEVIV